MPYSCRQVLPTEGEQASSPPPNPPPAVSPRRSPSLSSLTSFSSSMSIFQPTPPLDAASPPMPIPDTFDLDAVQNAKPPPAPAPAWPQTPPPSATRSPPSRPARRATAFRAYARGRACPVLTASPCPRGKRKRSPAVRQRQAADATTTAALRDENQALRQAKWALENANAVLRARLLTCAEQVRHAHAVEARLDHAQRYVRALQKQVRSLGGFVVRLGSGGGGEDKDDGNNDDNEAGASDSSDDSGDDGELPAASHVPAYFPDAARHPHKYTMLEMQREKALGKKTRPKLKN